MEFKVGYGNYLIYRIAGIICLMVIILFGFFSTDQNTRLYVSCCVWVFYVFWLLFQVSKPIYYSIFGKTVLIVNETYIFDCIRNIKYYWKDIEEIDEDGGFLFITLCRPGDYLNKIRNPIKKWQAERRIHKNKRISFLINADIVDVDTNELLEILDGYSNEALAIEREAS